MLSSCIFAFCTSRDPPLHRIRIAIERRPRTISEDPAASEMAKTQKERVDSVLPSVGSETSEIAKTQEERA